MDFVLVEKNRSCILFICLFVYLFIFRLHCVACGILAPRPGIEPMPPALGAQSLNHWTTREVPAFFFLNGGTEGCWMLFR